MDRLIGLLRRLLGGRVARREARQERLERVDWLVAGLGNPGPRYAESRHNLGREAVARFAARHRVTVSHERWRALAGTGPVGEARVAIVEPQTFYNETGECMAAAIRALGVGTNRLIVVHDDLDLENGRLRIRRGGSDGGNRGVRSIVELFGVDDFIRVRIGIGHPPAQTDTMEYVLGRPGREEAARLEEAVDRAAEAIEIVITEGVERAMNRFNQRV